MSFNLIGIHKLNLYPKIEAELRKNIEFVNASSVSEVWSAFKSTLIKSDIDKHSSVGIYCFNSDCCFLEGITYFRIGLEYRLYYEIENEKYEHSEDISCEFKLTGSVELEKEEEHAGDGFTSDTFTMEQMFTNIENWKAYQLLKDKKLEFEVYACEI